MDTLISQESKESCSGVPLGQVEDNMTIQVIYGMSDLLFTFTKPMIYLLHMLTTFADPLGQQ